MIQLKEVLTPSQVLVNIDITSKKRALEMIAQTVIATCTELSELDVFEQLIQRERLGTTGFGKGVAIPHCRMDGCSKPVIVVLKLSNPIDFNAVDEQLVDILIGLVVPTKATDNHLQLLKQIAELLTDTEICKQIRASTTSEAVYQLIVDGVINS